MKPSSSPWDAIGSDYFVARLADPSLLDASLVLRSGLLVVPVGGRRRGGYHASGVFLDVLRTAATLAGRPGFPHVRVRWSRRADTCHTVEWGGRPPPGEDHVARGRFYGYSTAAIAAFLREQDLLYGVDAARPADRRALP